VSATLLDKIPSVLRNTTASLLNKPLAGTVVARDANVTQGVRFASARDTYVGVAPATSDALDERVKTVGMLASACDTKAEMSEAVLARVVTLGEALIAIKGATSKDVLPTVATVTGTVIATEGETYVELLVRVETVIGIIISGVGITSVAVAASVVTVADVSIDNEGPMYVDVLASVASVGIIASACDTEADT
jgi:hypothetical protein